MSKVGLAARPGWDGPTGKAVSTGPSSRLTQFIRCFAVRARVSNSVLGDPRGASASEGRKLLTKLRAGLSEILQRLLNNMTAGEPVPNGLNAWPARRAPAHATGESFHRGDALSPCRVRD